jgi:uncharacterized protein (DUF1501 family)
MGCSAAIAAMAGGRVAQLAFANEANPMGGTDEIFVMIFLRGGLDGLSLLSPYNDGIYQSKRKGLALPTRGEFKALAFNTNNPAYPSGDYFGLNTTAAPLLELYTSGELAFIHACGLNDDTRSHFDAMDYIERGTPGEKTTSTGWISRHLDIIGLNNATLPVMAAGSSAPTSLLGSSEAVAMGNPRDFGIDSNWRYNHSEKEGTRYPWADQMLYRSLEKMYPASGTSLIETVGRRTVETIATIRAANVGDYTPANGASYPNGSFGNSLRSIAQTIKLELGLQVATVDLGGWDTHESQGAYGDGYFARKIDELARGLHAFYTDLDAFKGRLTVAVMSEFGRRLGANDSDGTDHGHGNVMMVLGGGVQGGKCYGSWPGLEDLDQDQDLSITTDYRTVLSEILLKRLGNNKLGQVFPGMTAVDYNPLNLLEARVDPGLPDFSSFAAPGGASRNGDATLNQEYKLYLPVVTRC